MNPYQVEPGSNRFGHLSILLLEKNPKLRAIMEKELLKLRISSILSVGTIQDAQSALNEKPIDILLLRWEIPEEREDIFAFLSSLRADVKWKDLPVVIMHRDYSFIEEMIRRNLFDGNMERIVIPFHLSVLAGKIGCSGDR